MSTNWKGPIGPVLIKSAHRESWDFPTLLSALEAARKAHLHIMDRLPVSFEDRTIPRFMPHYRCVIIEDDCGLTVPLWRIEEEARLLPAPKPWRRPANYDPDRDFRNGPLPGMGYKRRYGRMFRRMRTHAELRDLHGLEADLQDLEDFPLRVKIRGRRKNIPSAWDDIVLSCKGDGWKNYRKTQYREKI